MRRVLVVVWTLFLSLCPLGVIVLGLEREAHAQGVPSVNELVHNGGFNTFTPCSPCNGPTIPGWDVFAAPYDVDPNDGSLLVSQGGSSFALVQYHFKSSYQNTVSELVAGGGLPFTLSFRVRVTEPARVRSLFAVHDDTGYALPVVVAERTVQTPNQWTTLVGTFSPTWTGVLQSAELVFEVEKVITGNTYSPSITNDANPYPTFSLDDVTFVRDVDGDGLTDREEATCTPAPGCLASFCAQASQPWTDFSDVDTDGDTLPDGWEWRNCLDPLSAADADDAGLPASFCSSSPTPCGGTPAMTPPAWDPDCDGATNLEELWAATDPNDACQVPGKPADTGASSAAKQVLRYLALLPSHGSQNRAVVGQHITSPVAKVELPNGISTTEQCAFVEQLAADTQRYPGILSLQYDNCDTTQCYDPATLIQQVNDRAIRHWKKGGLVLIKWGPPNPWSPAAYGGSNASVRATSSTSDDPSVDLNQLAAGANLRFNAYIADVAAGLLTLKQNGVVVLFRPFSEMNADNFWWGGRPHDAFVGFWRYMFNQLKTFYQLDNLLWVYEADSGAHGVVPVDYYYPGDAYVDVYGHNFYDDDWLHNFSAARLSTYYPKVLGFPQSGPGPTRDGTWDLATYLDGDNGNGGGLKNAYARASFFVAWSSYETASSGTSSIFNAHVQGYQSLALVDNNTVTPAAALFADPWVATREDIAALTPSCTDDLKNQGETGTDCGGPCGPCNCVSVGGNPAPDGVRCDDGNACTQRDRCLGGVCVGTVPVVCDTCGECNAGSVCDPLTGACNATPAADGTPCNDGNPCTVDTCQGGGCVAVPVANGTSCDDGDACTTTSSCSAGVCVGAAPVVCTAIDACHLPGVCNPNNGTCSTPLAPDGVACDDGEPCTQTSACSAGTCVGAAPVPDGTVCDDQNVCSAQSSCASGVCVGSSVSALHCDDGILCTTDSCDPVLGCKHNATACCFDGLQNQGEAGVDCGGPCAPCSYQLNVGFDHACQRSADGKIECWGTNTFGQLGGGSTTSSASSQPVVGIAAASNVGAGIGHSCASLLDGTVWCWGDNADAQLGTTAVSSSSVPVLAGIGGGDVTAVSAGAGHTCALHQDGSVSCWGRGFDGQLGHGFASSATPIQVTGLPGPATALATGGVYTSNTKNGHTCALIADGTVSCWGNNMGLQVGSPVPGLTATPNTVSLTGATQLAVGSIHSCAVLSNGQVMCWGSNSFGQLGNIAAGTGTSTPIAVSNLGSTAVAVAAGRAHTCALLTGGTVKCWGAGTAGQLGNSASVNSANLAVSATGVTGAIAIDAGGDRTCAQFSGGRVKCWGQNLSNFPVTVNGISHCSDGVLNQGETAVDCGGPCAPCCTGGACCTGAPNGKACSDGNPCTSGDSCQAGVCKGTSVACGATDACHAPATCSAATGYCVETAVSDGTGCDDGDACTVGDACAQGLCVGGSPVVCLAPDDCHAAGTCDSATGACSNPALNDGTTCADGNGCTQTDVCVKGMCQGANTVVCQPLDVCHSIGVCDTATGQCSNPNAVDGKSCNDGNACSLVDVCTSGVCGGLYPVTCTALDTCHGVGVCDPATGVCSNPTFADGTPCNDGNACTQTDTCQAGVCVGSNPVVCVAQGVCRAAGTCNSVSGQCTNPNSPDGTPCNDGNACTQTDTCQSGICTGANPVVCTASDACHTAGICNTSTGLCTNPSAPNGTACNDGNACTQTDSCQGGLCLGSNPVSCPAIDQCHAVGTCNTATGTCSTPSQPDGTFCNDGNACTKSDTCLGGVCKGGPAVVCTALDACHLAGTCNTSTGLCTNPNKLNGAPCNDGNACTKTDTCQAGVCTGSNTVTCVAADACHSAGTCSVATGLCSSPAVPYGTPCDDGNACTTTDICQNGICAGKAVVCPTPNGCQTAGTCNPSTGTCTLPSVADGTPCNDGNACTQSDTCQGGQCVGANPVVCTASNACRVPGVCNTSTGVCSIVFAADGTACNDSNACTTVDACVAGTCTGGAPIVCQAQDACHVAGTCNTTSGVCTNPNAANGTACNDGDACTSPDVCLQGVCKGSTVCNDGNSCTTVDTCIGGTCVGQAPGPANGTSCNDNNPCTTGETCSAGVCSGTAISGGSCDDNNACTSNDTCQSGTCVGTPSVTCSALDVCHVAGTCDPSTGLCSNPAGPNGVTCNDASLCTLNDACQSGLCQGANATAAACYDETDKLVSDQPSSTGPYRQIVVDGDTAAMQANGSVYVFERVGGVWSWQVTLVANNGTPLGRIALDGDTLVAGAINVGSAYVFRRSSGAWLNCGGAGPVPVCTQEVSLHPTNLVAGDAFGSAVAISGDVAVVSSPGADSGMTTNGGSVYVFERVGGSWLSCTGAAPQVCSQQAELYPSDPVSQKVLGKELALDGTTLVVAAQGDTLVPGKGSVYVFERVGSVWTQEAKLVSAASASFGTAVDVSGDTIAVGSYLDDRSPVVKAGSVYVFEKTAGAWSSSCSGVSPFQCSHTLVTLIASDRAGNDWLGQSVAIRGGTIVAGATRHDHGAIPGTANTGAAYTLRREGGLWGSACTGSSPAICTEDDELVPTDSLVSYPVGSNKIGQFVDLSGSTVVVGAITGGYVFDLPLSQGCGCQSDLDCLSGICEDGVCCDAACGGSNPSDSLACSVLVGASQNGTCQVVQGSTCVAGAACFEGDLCQ